MTARLEHVNIAVPDAKATAGVLQSIFGWQIRWEGAALNGGYSVHIGDEGSYLALYSPKDGLNAARPRYRDTGSLCHVGLVVDDLDNAERSVTQSGYKTHNHQEYEPGRRFYFDGPDGVEYEVVSYA